MRAVVVVVVNRVPQAREAVQGQQPEPTTLTQVLMHLQIQDLVPAVADTPALAVAAVVL